MAIDFQVVVQKVIYSDFSNLSQNLFWYQSEIQFNGWQKIGQIFNKK